MYSTEPFFSLRKFAHRSLWQEGAFVWSALSKLEAYIKRQAFKIEIVVPKHVHLQSPELISIGEGTVIEPGVFIQGPCIIGKHCIIRHSAYLRGPVILGDHCAIGHSAEIKHSILLDFASATHLVYVGDSILGNRVNVAAGVKCANLRFDRKGISVVIDDKKVKTGLMKFGAVIGDRSQIGCNTVLNPGTLIGRESICYPLLNVHGYIPPRSRIKGAFEWTVDPIQERALERIGR